MKAKHFLINMGKNIWPLFLASPHRQRLGMLPADMPLQVCTLICCQNVGLQVRERFAIYWSVHGVLIHTIFSTPVSFCQNAISQIDERTENVQHEEQKTQEKDKRAWALYSINWKLVMGKESCLALFQTEQLPQMDKSYRGVNFSSNIEEVSLSTLQALYAPPSFLTQVYSQKPVLLPWKNSPTNLYSPSPEISLLAMEVLPALKGWIHVSF